MNQTYELGIRITADGRVLVSEAGKGEQAVARIGNASEAVNRQAASATASLVRMGQAAAAAFSVREITQASDAWSTLNARLSLVSGSAAATAVAYQRVFEIAQATRQGVEEVGLVYERFARQADALGLDQARLAAITTTVSQAMVISGASAESSRAALMQLGQGIASGTLRGEELNSVMEQAPRLAQALADGLGVPIGKLREMGEQGQITAEKLVTALEGQGDRIGAEFARMPVTVSAALTNVRNAWVDTVGSFEQSSGVFRATAGGIQLVAEHMDAVAVVGGTVAAVMGGRVVSALAAGTAGKIAAAQAARQLAVADLEAATAAQAAAAAQVRAAGAYGAGAVATKALADANAALAAAQSAAAATGPLATGIRMLGGPIGIVTTLLMAGATAWSLWGDSAKAAADKARDELRAAQEEAVASGKALIEILRAQEAEAKAAYDVAPRDSEGMRDITGPEGAAWTRAQQRVIAETERLKNLAAQMKASAGSAIEAWDASKLGTKVEDQSRRLAQLAQEYNAAMLEAVKLGKAEKDRAQIVATYEARRDEILKSGSSKKAAIEKPAIDAEVKANQQYAAAIGELVKIKAKAIGVEQNLTAAEQVRLKLIESGAWDQLAPETRKVVDAYVAAANAAIDLADAEKAAQKAAEEYRKEVAASAADAEKEAERIVKENEQLREQIDTLGMNSEQLAAYRVRKLEVAAATAEAAAEEAEYRVELMKVSDGLPEVIEEYKRLAKAKREAAQGYRDKAALTGESAEREAAVKAANAWTSIFEQGANDVYRSMTDALIRSGEDGSKDIVSQIGKALKTTAFRVAIQAGVSLVMNGAAGLLGMGNGSGTGSLINTGGNLVSTGSGLYQLYSGFTTGGGTGMWGAAGNWLGNTSVGSAVGGYGSSTAAMYGTNVGSQQTAMLAAQDAGLTGTNAGASAWSGAATGLAWFGALIAIANYLDGKLGGPKREGDAFATFTSAEPGGPLGASYSDRWVNGSYWFTGGAEIPNMTNPAYEAAGWDAATQQGIPQYIDQPGAVSMNQTVRDTVLAPFLGDVRTYLEGLGGSIAGMSFGLGWSTDPEGSAPDQVAASVADKLGNIIYSHSGEIGDVGTAVPLEMKRMTLAAVDAADINKVFEKIVHGVDLASASAEQLDAAFAKIKQAASVLDLAGLLGLDAASAEAVVAGAEDIGALGEQMSVYYSLFYSEEERRVAALADMATQFEALGVAMPDSLAGFRSLMDGLDKTTDSGLAMYNALLKLAPAFAQVTTAAGNAAATTSATASQQQAWAENTARAQAAAANAQYDAAREARRVWMDLASDLQAYLGELQLALSQQSPEQAYTAAKAAFDSTSRRAQLGDQAAAGSLRDVSNTFLEASRAWYASSAGYSQDMDAVQAAVQAAIAVGQRQSKRAYDFTLGKIPAYASGGTASGLFLAGEAGPELIYSPSAVRVLNHRDTGAVLDSAPIVAGLRAVQETTANGFDRLDSRLAAVERRLDGIEQMARLEGARPALRGRAA